MKRRVLNKLGAKHGIVRKHSMNTPKTSTRCLCNEQYNSKMANISKQRMEKKSFIVQRSNLFEFATWKTTTNVALLACVCAGTIARLSPDFTRNKCTTCANTPDGIGEQK